MQINDYVPEMYNKNLEMYNIINSERDELENNLKPSIDNSFIDTFANKATEKGITNFENILNIAADPMTESLDIRRERVMNRLITQIPYTERFMISKINGILGEGTWSYNMNYNNYTLTITSSIPGRIWYGELISFLNRIIPCNIKVNIEIYSATWDLVKDTFNTWDELSDMTWEQVMNAEWNN